MSKKKKRFWGRWWQRRERRSLVDRDGYAMIPVPRTLREAVEDYEKPGLSAWDWWISPMAIFRWRGGIWVYIDTHVEWDRGEEHTLLINIGRASNVEEGAIGSIHLTREQQKSLRTLDDDWEIDPEKVARVALSRHKHRDTKGKLAITIR